MVDQSVLTFDRTFTAKPGEVVRVGQGEISVRRITANNPGPMTFTGTNSYIVGSDRLAVIDPGPDKDDHLRALLKVIGHSRVDAICITHTHRDHSPLARRLKEATGAPIIGAGPHQFARAFQSGDAPVDQAADEDHRADQVLEDGDTVQISDFQLEAVATPGHTMNHLCFALPGANILFSGDHVMGWATSLVAPPDGAMTPYLHSLKKLLDRPEAFYLPGHGTWLENAKPYVRMLQTHRMEREASILAALAEAPLTINHLVDRLYDSLDGRLYQAAGLSVLAHLERLEVLAEVRQIDGSTGHWCKI